MTSENRASATVRVSRDKLARRVVARVAPDELAAFSLLAVPYRGEPRSRPRAERDRPLGSGLGDVSGAVTPVVVVVTGWAVAALVSGAAEEVKNRGTRWTAALLDLLSRKPRDSDSVEVPVAALSDSQLRAVRTSVCAKAEHLGMDSAAAVVLSDAVVGELVLLRPEGVQESQT
ncbi:hypothetical protein [Streptomyces sp. NPDC058653]|uniref:hypothetical protein n=1 Tax=Streptomyces sp. NPDC058653 TaxID=3346576 RepID=UPI00364FFF70